MFARAYEAAAQFTFPEVVSWRRIDGSVLAGMGAFMPLNADGWIVTAGHVLSIVTQAEQDAPMVAELDRRVSEIEHSADQPHQKKKKIARLQRSNEWIRTSSVWFADNDARIVEGVGYTDADLALCKLEPSTTLGSPSFQLSNDRGQS